MAQKVILKRKITGGSGVEVLHPETHIDQVQGFLYNDKIPIRFLPEEALSPGTLRFEETISGAIDAVWLDLRFDSPGARPQKGWFFIATGATTLPEGEVQYHGGGLKYQISYAYKDDGDENLTLEKGDWLIINNLTWTGNPGDTVYIEFAIINNTYGDATTSVPGVVQLGNHETIASLSGNSVVTEAKLKTLFSEKQNAHARLSTIAGLTAPTTGKKTALTLTDSSVASTEIYTTGSVTLATLSSGGALTGQVMTGVAVSDAIKGQIRFHKDDWDAYAKSGDILIEDVE